MTVNIVRVNCDDGPYEMLFAVPEGLDPLEATEIVNDAVGRLYIGEPEDPMSDLMVYLEGKGIVLANEYVTENTF